MYWDEELQCVAIHTFLGRISRFKSDALFSRGRPIEQFFQLYKHRGALSHGERVILEIAPDFWSRQGNVHFNELYILSSQIRKLVLSLYQAPCDCPEAIQQWIEAQSQE